MNSKNLFSFATLIILANPVWADDVLYTPMVEIATANPGAPLSGLRCNVVNAFHAPRNGTLSIIEAEEGKVLATASFQALRQGQVTGVAVSNFSNSKPITLAYCKITVHRKKGTIRGSMSRIDANGNAAVIVEAK